MRGSTYLALLLIAGCGVDDGSYGKQAYGTESLAIRNAEGEKDRIRTGTNIKVGVPEDTDLKSNTIYDVSVKNTTSGKIVGKAKLLSDMVGKLEMTTVAEDLGERDDVQPGDTLSIELRPADGGKVLARVDLPLLPRAHKLTGSGFQVDEVQPPYVFSADAAGKPLNAYAVGALPDPGENAPPIYAAGRGFPPGVRSVDVYVMRDRDEWKGVRLPQRGDEDYVAGPVLGRVDRGKLLPTKLDWTPTGKDIGPYDIVVDIDSDGTFDYDFSAKDAADGEDKVGLTIQYSAAWFRAKASADAAHVSAAAAKEAYQAADKAARAAEAVASAPEAKAKAAKARAAADAAKAQLAKANAAADAAKAAFERTLADAKVASSKATEAEQAAKSAADSASSAAKLASATKLAQKAYEARMKALAAKMLSRHLLVNLAYSSSARKGGQWSNTYDRSKRIYTYVNPPVQKGSRHAFVTKLVVRHQSWHKFWNNPELIQKGGKGSGRIDIKKYVVQLTGGSTQHSCTNSPPVAIINPQAVSFSGQQLLSYDIVFDYDNDGYYDIGRDLLDVVGHVQTASLISAKELDQLPESQIYGFRIKR